MEKTNSMKYNRDFRRLYSKGKSIAAGYLVLYYQKAPIDHNLLGITATKKLGCAVVRNRVRRLIRESYRLHEAEVQTGYKMVVVARGRSVGATYEQISRDMSYLLKKSGIITKNENKQQTK